MTFSESSSQKHTRPNSASERTTDGGGTEWLWECQGQAIKEKDGKYKGLKYLLNNIIRGGCKDKCLSGNQCSASLQRSEPQQDGIKNVWYIDYELIRCFTFGIIAMTICTHSVHDVITFICLPGKCIRISDFISKTSTLGLHFFFTFYYCYNSVNNKGWQIYWNRRQNFLKKYSIYIVHGCILMQKMSQLAVD